MAYTVVPGRWWLQPARARGRNATTTICSCCWAYRGFTAAHDLVTHVGTQIHSLVVTVIVDEEEPVSVRECHLALGFLVLGVIRRKYLIRVVHAVDIRFQVFRDISHCLSR